jgi:hypothetical protein
VRHDGRIAFEALLDEFGRLRCDAYEAVLEYGQDSSQHEAALFEAHRARAAVIRVYDALNPPPRR